MTKTEEPQESESAVDDPLKQHGGCEITQVVAIKRVLAEQIARAMKEEHITKAEMARRMRTSRSQLDRLLNPQRDSVTLETLARAARAIGRQMRVQLAE
jgi:antitoxin HicB